MSLTALTAFRNMNFVTYLNYLHFISGVTHGFIVIVVVFILKCHSDFASIRLEVSSLEFETQVCHSEKKSYK